MPGPNPSRREFLVAVGALGFGALAAACTKRSSSDVQTIESITRLKQGTSTLSLLSSNTPINPGKQRFGFDLSTSGGQLITGGSPKVWLSMSQTAPATGPFDANWLEFTGYQRTHDRSPRSPLPGTYVAEIVVPSAGNWYVLAVAAEGPRKAAGVGALPATTGKVPVQLGTKAIRVNTPVATSTFGLEAICTRVPVCHMHYVSLDKAFASGKPSVVVFATPLLCESRLCGPVTDEAILVYQKLGPAKANFVHVEEFLPGPDHKPPLPELQNQSPGFKSWHLETEPWTVIVDANGMIRWKAEGPTTAPEIEAALQSL